MRLSRCYAARLKERQKSVLALRGNTESVGKPKRVPPLSKERTYSRITQVKRRIAEDRYLLALQRERGIALSKRMLLQKGRFEQLERKYKELLRSNNFKRSQRIDEILKQLVCIKRGIGNISPLGYKTSSISLLPL